MGLNLADCISIKTLNLNWPGCVGEHRFHPVRKWRFDFAWPEQKVAVEIDGGTALRLPSHTSIKGMERDREKSNQAALMGWTVLRYTTAMVRRGDIWIDLDEVFKTHGR